jgi:ABC-type transport system involved in multi-copper enzyme maturation permease subunit
MGSVAGELDRGTAALVLAQPVTRHAFLGAKLVALGLVLAVSTLLSVVVAWAYTAVLFESGPIGGWLAMAGLAWLALAAWGAVTFLASAATGSTTAAAGLGFVGLVGLSVAAAVPAFDRYLPSGLVGPAIGLASGAPDVDLGKLATAIAGTLMIIALSAAASFASFRAREL